MFRTLHLTHPSRMREHAELPREEARRPPQMHRTLRSLCMMPSECSLTSARATPANTRIGSACLATRSVRRHCRAYSITMCSLPRSQNAP
eukprot:5097433-Pleurochrysis_carterae.AAC.3